MDANYSGLIAKPYNPDASVTDRVRADKRALDYPTGAFSPIVLKLDNAQPGLEIGGGGDVLYLDRRSTGAIRFRPDVSWPISFPLSANDGVKKFPYKQLLLDWDAQPGLVAYLWQGYGVDLALAIGAITSIGSITSPVTKAREIYGTSFVSLSTLAAATPLNVISAGSNINGYDLIDAQLDCDTSAGSYPRACIIAKATAPTGESDNDELAYSMSVTGGSFAVARILNPIFVSSGKRLDFLQQNAAQNSKSRALYTLK